MALGFAEVSRIQMEAQGLDPFDRKDVDKFSKQESRRAAITLGVIATAPISIEVAVVATAVKTFGLRGLFSPQAQTSGLILAEELAGITTGIQAARSTSKKQLTDKTKTTNESGDLTSTNTGSNLSDPPNTYRDANNRLRATAGHEKQTNSFVSDPNTEKKSPSVKKPSSGGLTSHEKGELGVSKSEQQALERGEKIRGKEVSIELSNKKRTKVDLLTEKPDGGLKAIECKNGPCAKLTDNQKTAEKELPEIGGTFRGKRAEEAGFKAGEESGPIEFQIDRHDITE